MFLYLFCAMAWCPQRDLQIHKDMYALGCLFYKGQALF